MEKFKLEISWSSLWRVVVVGIFVLLLYYLRDVAVTILLSIFISTALNGIVLKFERFKIPRIISTIIIFGFAMTLLAFLIYAVLPIAIIELNALLNNLDGTVSGLLGTETTARIRSIINPDLNHLANILLAGNVSFLDVVGRFLGGVAYFFTVLIMSFYLTVSRAGVPNFLRAVFPEGISEKAIHIYERTRRKISSWFHTQLLLSFIVSVIVFSGLSILGVKYALILSILAGLMELVPVVGPIFAGTMSVIIAMAESTTIGIYVFILFVIIQQIESNVLVPLMLKRAIDIHPVIVLVSLLAGAELMGIAGIILAVPMTVLAEELLAEWTSRRAKISDTISV